jgi:hypothetical protein
VGLADSIRACLDFGLKLVLLICALIWLYDRIQLHNAAVQAEQQMRRTLER